MTKFIGKKNTPYLLRKDIFSKSVLRYTKKIFEKYLVVHCYNCCFIAVLSTDRKKNVILAVEIAPGYPTT